MLRHVTWQDGTVAEHRCSYSELTCNSQHGRRVKCPEDCNLLAAGRIDAIVSTLLMQGSLYSCCILLSKVSLNLSRSYSLLSMHYPYHCRARAMPDPAEKFT
jgi:hypothetical protein